MGCASSQSKASAAPSSPAPLRAGGGEQDKAFPGRGSSPSPLKAGRNPQTGRRSVRMAVTDIQWQGADKGALSRSDPCCVVEIPGRPDCTFSTIIIRGMASGPWNHEATFSGCEASDALAFSVKNKEHGCLGEATMSSSRFFDNGFDGMLPVAKPGKGKSVVAWLKVKIWTELEDVSEQEASTISTRSVAAGREADPVAEEETFMV
mmetsp:Transcript_81804/g.253868  ORF Transcript_81804/g.253868 Transcript_81804/m.253868 type:complete len:206 (-) Transcript_81804:647-1264(-)